MSATAVSFQNVDIIFGKRAAEGLALLDQGATRTEILAECGAILGVADCLARRRRGRDHRADGPVRLRQVDADARRQRPEQAGPRHASIVKDGERHGRRRRAATPAVLRRIRMHRVAMVFQQFALLPWRTVAENVGFGLELAGVPEAERKRARRRSSSSWSASRRGPANMRRSFPAACSSASAWRAPSPPKRRSC